MTIIHFIFQTDDIETGLNSLRTFFRILFEILLIQFVYIFIIDVGYFFLLFKYSKGKLLKQQKVPLKYSFKEIDNYLSVNVSGNFTLSDAKKMFTEALEMLVKKKLFKLFFNVYKVKGRITTMDRYHLADYAAMEAINFLLKGLPRLSVAFYGIEPIIDPERFGELVAKNRGLNIKVTTDKNEALNFLENG
jgi:hypothetical protein